jgi:hypothetical protein
MQWFFTSMFFVFFLNKILIILVLQNLAKLKKLDISFNRLDVLPELNETNIQFEFLDISHNNIDKLDVRSKTFF